MILQSSPPVSAFENLIFSVVKDLETATLEGRIVWKTTPAGEHVSGGSLRVFPDENKIFVNGSTVTTTREVLQSLLKSIACQGVLPDLRANMRLALGNTPFLDAAFPEPPSQEEGALEL